MALHEPGALGDLPHELAETGKLRLRNPALSLRELGERWGAGQALVAQYDAYQPLPGLRIKGRQTLAENIAYGRTDATAAQIEAAARAARAHEFVSALPQGYATVVGDQGVRLSGGQKQRIALARALLKDPPILVLDEATAMFDPQGEAEFIAQCHDVLKQRTVILITHRPASLALADTIYRLQDGVLERLAATPESARHG